jgi:hypothetical protein
MLPTSKLSHTLICFNSYTVGPNQTKKQSIEAKQAEPTIKPTLEKKMDDAIRDLKIDYLSKVSEVENDTSFNDLWKKFVLEYPDCLQLYMAKLKYMDDHPKRHEHLAEVITAANDIINRISQDDLAKSLGRKVDMENGDSIQVRNVISNYIGLLNLIL